MEWSWGSTVDGAVHPLSDMDLAVLLNAPERSLAQWGAMQHDLQTCFPGRDVDMAILNHADPLFLKKVVERCRLLYGSPQRLERLKLFAFKRYQDYRRFLISNAVTSTMRSTD